MNTKLVLQMLYTDKAMYLPTVGRWFHRYFGFCSSTNTGPHDISDKIAERGHKENTQSISADQHL